MDDHAQAAPVASLLRTLEHRLRAIVEPSLVLAAVGLWAQARSAEELCATLRHVLDRPLALGCTFDPLLEALHRCLQAEPADGGFPYDIRAAVYARACEAGDDDILRLLRQTPPMRASRDGARSLPREMADVPLGRRRSLAKGADRRILGLLACDPDPTVVRNLLRNPRLREPDVLRLAAARPAHATALREIGRALRFARLTSVRTALARNPYTPVALALQMLNGLSLRELREIATDATLHADVRAHASTCLARRQSSRTASRESRHKG
jgi:hypothetical protein